MGVLGAQHRLGHSTPVVAAPLMCWGHMVFPRHMLGPEASKWQLSLGGTGEDLLMRSIQLLAVGNADFKNKHSKLNIPVQSPFSVPSMLHRPAH